mmetsp:Transcript_47257/g.118317  ORF Transcript_47257/g.118317 Transcript_47257/m.118317 type:complete len:414 (-) Transcript_47257:115-1356(-)
MLSSPLCTRTGLMTARRLRGLSAAGGDVSRPRTSRAICSVMAVASSSPESGGKTVWIRTKEKTVLTTALEAGLTTFLFDKGADDGIASAFAKLGRFTCVQLCEDGTLTSSEGDAIGSALTINGADDLKLIQSRAQQLSGIVLADFGTDSWRSIPAENLVAAFQNNPAVSLLATCQAAAEARPMIEALQTGTSGVCLETDDPAEVRSLLDIVRERNLEGVSIQMETAVISKVEPAGMGDRVCVDTCSLLEPGEGMLVGNFARALFLIHSECSASSYIASRPFRVNAGPVHAYVQSCQGKTAYLSELASGGQVTVVNAEGRMRNVTVGRLKVETRPLVLVEASTKDGKTHSTLLQNAETVQLVGPQSRSEGGDKDSSSWRAIPVSSLKIGDAVYLHRQCEARHTGIAIKENIVEK